jgi:kumamolisin
MFSFTLAITLVLTGLPPGPPPLAANVEVHRAPPDEPRTFRLALGLRNRAGLDALIAAQHDPHSAQFRRYLTPEQFADRFGRSPSQYATLVRFFRQAGLSVQTFPSRSFLELSGRSSQFEHLFGVQLFVGSGASPAHFHTFRGVPSLPTEIASVVGAVFGLDTQAQPHRKVAADACTLQGNTGTQDTFGPDDLRAFYDMGSLLDGGQGGAGTELVLLGSVDTGDGVPSAADVQRYFTQFAHAQATLVTDSLASADPSSPSDLDTRLEEELDPEMVVVGAPAAASVHEVLAPEEDLFAASFAYTVNDLPQATAVSTSFGICETYLAFSETQANIQALADLVAQGVAEGQSWFVASGDFGPTSCGPSSSFASVDFPADLPYVVAVGGTMYTGAFDATDRVQSWNSEVAWNEYGVVAGGGGMSQLFARPVWQSAPGVQGNAREVPDIALLSGVAVGVGVVFGDGGLSACGNGTSDASPLAAGMFAAVSARLGCRLGAPMFELYPFASAQLADAGPAAFHDIAQGNTNTSVPGWSAVPGYDEATGLGSLDLAQLYAAYVSAGGCNGFDGGWPSLPDGGNQLLDAGALIPDGGLSCDPQSVPPFCPLGYTCAASDAGYGTCEHGCNAETTCPTGEACWACSSGCAPVHDGGSGPGGPCASDADCAGFGTCITNFPGGFCMLNCASYLDDCSCGLDSVCVPTGDNAICLPRCTPASSSCRNGLACSDVGNGVSSCLPWCQSDGDCLIAGDVCDLATGACLAPPGVDAGIPTSSSTGGASNSSTSGSTGRSSASSTSATGSGSSGGASGTNGASGSTASTSASTATATGSTGSSGTRGSTSKSKGCGCASSEDSAGLLALFALAAVSRRKRSAIGTQS